MVEPDSRGKLARRQDLLVRALTGGGPAPAGFDAGRLRSAAEALAAKRRRAAAAACPALAAALGARYAGRFDAYARSTPLPADGGPLADARAFAAELAAGEELPDAVRLEVLAIDLRHVRQAGGLRRRRGPSVALVRLANARLAVALRLPPIGEWWWSFPLGRFGAQRPQGAAASDESRSSCAELPTPGPDLTRQRSVPQPARPPAARDPLDRR